MGSVGSAIDRGDHSRRTCPGPRYCRHVVERDATNGDHRDLHRARNFVQGRQSYRGISVGLGLGWEHGTEADVVGASGGGELGLGEVVGRDTNDQRFGAGRSPYAQHLGQRQIVLSKMNDVGRDSQGHIQAIVHTQRNPARAAHRPQRVPKFAEGCEAELFGPKLQTARLGRE